MQFAVFAPASLALALLLLPAPSVSPSDGAALLPAGDPAPDFAFVSHAKGWQSLHGACAQEAILLVLDPVEGDLILLQSEAESLGSRGVQAIAVLRQSDRANWALIDRLGLRYSLMSDPHGVVATAFGAAPAEQYRPAWFVIDRAGRVRSSTPGGILGRDIAALAGSALDAQQGPGTFAGGEAAGR